MRHQDAVLAGVAGDDRVVRQVAHQFADHPLRQDRLGRRVIGRRVEIAVRLALLRDPRDAGLAAARRPCRVASRSCARICAASPSTTCSAGKVHDALRGSMSIWMKVCRVGSSSLGFSQAVSLGAEFRADHQHEVGLADAGIGRRRAEGAEHAERQRVRLRETCPCRRRWSPPACRALPAARAAARRPARCARRCRR